MTLQKMVAEAKERARSAEEVDGIADWLIQMVLSGVPEDFPESKHLLIGDGSPRGWALYVGAHRRDFAGTIEHVRSATGVSGRLVLRESLPNNEFGPVVYAGCIHGHGFEYADGNVVQPNYVGQTTNADHIRKRLAIEMLHAIQEALPQF